MTWKVEIERWHPKSLNELLKCHWAKRNRLKRVDIGMVLSYCRLYTVPQATTRRKVRMTYVVRKASRQKLPDEDNLWKAVLDGLKEAKAIVDDSPQWIRKDPVVYARHPKQWGVILELEDCG